MRRLFLFTCLFLLGACSIPGTTLPASAPPETTRVPSRTPLPSPTERLPPASTSSPTPPACLGQGGQVVVDELEDPSLPRSLPYRIYLPPCYDVLPETRYPTLYLLHGLASTDSQWDDLGVDETAGSMITSGQAPPFLIVMPWERKGLEYETAIVDGLVPAIDRTYRALPGPRWHAMGGISRGAGWALRIGLKHPDVFATIGLHSPAVLSPDLYYIPAWLEAIAPEQMPRLWIDTGDHDVLRRSTEELADLLNEQDVQFSWHLFPGYHAPEYWSAHLEDYLRWYTEEW